MSHLASDYHYELPAELIAQTPVHPRDASRLLVIHRKTQSWEHRQFTDLPHYLNANDVLVVNNSKVMKARLLGQRCPPATGKIEFVLLEETAPLTWEGLYRGSARATPGLQFQVPAPDGTWLYAKVLKGSQESPSGCVTVQFDRDPLTVECGEIPLPPYIQSDLKAAETDYQTAFAKILGSAAAPTAGLHFTPALLDTLKNKGVSREELTLHVGVGTFRPVKTADIREHIMHEERYKIDPTTAQNMTQAKKNKKRIVAVGTTSVRTLETAWDPSTQSLRPGLGRSTLFIYPEVNAQPFQVVDCMITNFHLPQSTLLMLVSAFAGRELVLAAYKEAIREQYRFFSYGDAMLIL